MCPDCIGNRTIGCCVSSVPDRFGRDDVFDLIQFFDLVYTVRAFQSSALIDVSKLKVVGIVSLALGVATDMATAGALCYFLRGLKTGYSKCAASRH